MLMKKLCTLIALLVTIVTGAKSQSMNETPLTLEAVEAGTVNIVNPNLLTIEYNKNGSGWTASTTNPISIEVAANDVVQFRGDNACYWAMGSSSEIPTRFTATSQVYVYGNIMSLVHKDDFATNSTLTSANAFAYLFSAPSTASVITYSDRDFYDLNSTITNHPTNDIVLAATSVPEGGYMYMFAGCEGLTRSPQLPAETLGDGCYHRMFGECSALVTAPALPATTLAPSCYDSMFYKCTSLSTSPALPATTLASSCYLGMFTGCTSLVSAPGLPATTLTEDCYHRMFEGCTSLTKAPVLPAPILFGQVYGGMFDGCTSLNYVKCLATNLGEDVGVYSSVADWLADVAATGTFVKADVMSSWRVGIDGIPSGWTVKNASEEVASMNETPLTIEATEDATTITITNPLALTIEYSTNGGTSWTASSANPITISGINAGQTVQLRGNNAAYASSATKANATIITFDKDCYAYGNVMSLISSTDFATNTILTSDFAFYGLFYQSTHLINHATKDIVLPATTLTESCYASMFLGCSALTKAFALPATTLATKCYRFMYSGCSNLATACELPATKLAEECYSTMFQSTALTSAPVLPATTLAKGCYMNMFRACSKFAVAPVLPATTLAESCYEYMFHSAPLTSAPALPATTLANRCYFGMFLNCANLPTAPTLPATTLAESCYNGMFYGSGLTAMPALPATTVPSFAYSQMFANCNSLTTVSALPAARVDRLGYRWMFQGCQALTTSPAILATSLGEDACYYMFQNCINLEIAGDLSTIELEANACEYMFSGCTKLTKAPALPATTLAEQCYQRMFEECHSLVTAPKLPATNLADLCYNDMFWNCTSLKNAPVLPATKLVPYCYTMMFFGCSSLEKAPDLIAPTLEGNCYEHMFMNCTSLNYVKCLATDLGDETATDGWMTNVSAMGTFVKAPGVDWIGKGTTEGKDFDDPSKPCTFVHGIPAGWTVETSPIIFAHLNSDGDGNYWATFYNESAGFTADATTSVYTAKVSSDKSKVELTAVEDKTIPAGNAVVLKSSAEAATLTYAAAATETLADNELMASSTDITAPTNTYMLVKGASGVGFYHWKGTDIPANRGYLIIDGAGAREFFSIGEEVITGIKEIQDVRGKTDDVYYDLNGRRVLYPTKGIYVRNGKKIIFK